MSCMKRAWKRLFGNKPMRILLLGLDAAGKTTILYQLMGKGENTVPTIGFNVETIRVPPLEFLVWDVSGQERLRTFWRHYYHGTTGIVFVVDSHDVERLPIARRELHGILKEEELNDAVLLIIANKTDLPNAVSPDRLSQELDLQALSGRTMHIQPAVAQKGTGLKEGLVWLAKAMKQQSKAQARMQQQGAMPAQPQAVQPTPAYPPATATASQQPQQAYNYENPYDHNTNTALHAPPQPAAAVSSDHAAPGLTPITQAAIAAHAAPNTAPTAHSDHTQHNNATATAGTKEQSAVQATAAAPAQHIAPASSAPSVHPSFAPASTNAAVPTSTAVPSSLGADAGSV